MKFNIKRNDEYIEKLEEILKNKYDLQVKKIREGQRGLEGETWTVYLKDNKKVFIKIGYVEEHIERMKNSVIAINYMEKNNLTNTNKIIKTVDKESYTYFNDGILIVFEFIEGEVNFSISYKKVLEILIPFFKLEPLQTLPKENFEVESIIKNLEKYLNNEKYEDVFSVLNNYKEQITSDIKNLRNISNLITKDKKMFITHGDASVNIMETLKGEFVIDWDDVLIAPLERDCWVFMNFKEKIEDINDLLDKNGINYTLSNELLVFYAYKNYAIYLVDTIEKYIKLNNSEILEEIDDLVNGWIRERLNSQISNKVLKEVKKC